MNLDLLTCTDAPSGRLDTDDVPVEVKRQLIAQDQQMWKNTRFQAESRRRTYKRIGDTGAEAAQIEALEKCEAALMDLDEQLSALLKD